MTNDNEKSADRFSLTIDRIKALRAEQPLARGVDPMECSPDLVRAVAEACEVFGSNKVARAIGMGRTTIQEWRERAKRAEKVSAAPVIGFGGDLEIHAIVRCVEELERLDRDGRHRVLNYLDERFFGRYRSR